jgi:hypothetical protein
MMKKRIVKVLLMAFVLLSYTLSLSDFFVSVLAAEEVEIFNNNNIYGVQNGPTSPTNFAIDNEYVITKIVNYHYFNNGALPGTISIKHSDGTVYGPWKAEGSVGQGNVENAYWTVTPNEKIKAGTYTIIDSDPSTWSTNFESENQGFSIVLGYSNTTETREEPLTSEEDANLSLDESAWVYVETKTNDWENTLKKMSENEFWGNEIIYEEGYVQFTNAYIGADRSDLWVKNGLVQSGNVTWTKPSLKVIKPSEEFSMYVTTENTRLDHKNFGGIGSILVQVFRLNEEGKAYTHSDYLTDEAGNYLFISGQNNGYKPNAVTVYGKISAGAYEGERMTIRVTAVGSGINVETWYIYEWKLAKETVSSSPSESNEQNDDATNNDSSNNEANSNATNSMDENLTRQDIRISVEQPGLIAKIIKEEPLFPIDEEKKGFNSDEVATENGGFGNIGNIPGPSNAAEAVVAVTVPSLVAVLISLLSGIGGGSSPLGGQTVSISPLSNTPLSGDYLTPDLSTTDSDLRVSYEPGVISAGNEPYIETAAEDNTFDSDLRVSYESGVISAGNEPYIETAAEDNTFDSDLRVSYEPGVISTGNEPYIETAVEDNTFGNDLRVSYEPGVISAGNEPYIETAAEDNTFRNDLRVSYEPGVISAGNEAYIETVSEDNAFGNDLRESYEPGIISAGNEPYIETAAEDYTFGNDLQEDYESSEIKSKESIENTTSYNREGYDAEGYDAEGYDAEGYNVEGYNAEGYDAEGYNVEGYDAEGYDAEGYNAEGYDAEGYDAEGYDAEGYDAEGYDAEGYNVEGYDAEGYNDVEGYNAEGYNV